jgi:hypothetical protein
MKHQRAKATLKSISIALVLFAVTLLLIEPALRIVDPLGGYRYYSDLSRLFAGYVVSERGYSMYPGMYQFSNWDALIERSGNRHTPDSRAGGCTLAFLGDSVTFGFGVSDAETFVNLLAQQTDARLLNTAIPAYNSANILKTLHTTPAAGYVYVIISNDDEPTKTRTNRYPVASVFQQNSIMVYVDALTHLGGDAERDIDRFNADMAALDRPDVLRVAFRDPLNWYQTLPDDVVLLPMWTHGNSVIDGHPDKVGHAEIAQHLAPYVSDFAARLCGK